MPKLKWGARRKVYKPTSRGTRVSSRLVRQYDRQSPFVHGLARAIDVGGHLRAVDVEAARKMKCQCIETLNHPDADQIAIYRAWDAVGGYFHGVIGHPRSRIVHAEVVNE